MSERRRIASGLLASVAAVALAAGLASCSSGASTPDFGGTGDDGGPSQGASSGSSGASSGSTSSGGSGSSGGSSASGSGGSSSGSSGGSSGASGSGSSGASGSTSGSSSGSSGADGSVLPSRGCGQATSCTPGTDLAPPAAADGFQIALPANSITIQPGEEAYYCYYKKIPGSAAINVGAFQSWMTNGASHHFITFTGSGTDGAITGGPVGATACNPSGNWVYATSTSGQIIELKMPDGVGLPLPASQILILNMHFINPGSAPLSPEVKLNVLYAQNVQYTAQSMVSFNAGIAVPGGSATAPGMQTVSGTCTPPAGSKFFAYTTHTHKHATVTDVNYVSGGQTTNIVHSTQWDSPDVALWNSPNFLTIKAGDSLTYSCHYQNTGPTTVTVGETAATNEMCMSIGYFFPAASVSSGIGSSYCH